MILLFKKRTTKETKKKNFFNCFSAPAWLASGSAPMFGAGPAVQSWEILITPPSMAIITTSWASAPTI